MNEENLELIYYALSEEEQKELKKTYYALSEEDKEKITRDEVNAMVRGTNAMLHGTNAMVIVNILLIPGIKSVRKEILLLLDSLKSFSLPDWIRHGKEAFVLNYLKEKTINKGENFKIGYYDLSEEGKEKLKKAYYDLSEEKKKEIIEKALKPLADMTCKKIDEIRAMLHGTNVIIGVNILTTLKMEPARRRKDDPSQKGITLLSVLLKSIFLAAYIDKTKETCALSYLRAFAQNYLKQKQEEIFND